MQSSRSLRVVGEPVGNSPGSTSLQLQDILPTEDHGSVFGAPIPTKTTNAIHESSI